jgi:hypothetical protein
MVPLSSQLSYRTNPAGSERNLKWGLRPAVSAALNAWGYEPEDVIAQKHRDAFQGLFKSRLTGVLNERRLIRRGCLVDEVLCGGSSQPIGESSHGFISAKRSFTDDQGNTVPLCIELNVDTHS